MTPSEHSYPTTTSSGYLNITEAQENDCKSNLVKIEVFKEEMDTSFKETQENTIKQTEVFKEETNPLKKFKKIRLKGEGNK